MTQTALEQAAEALRPFAEAVKYWMPGLSPITPVEVHLYHCQAAAEALACLTAEQASAPAEINWDDPGVEHGYIPVTAPSVSADRHSAASATSRRENNNDRDGGRLSPVSPDREALAQGIDRYRQDFVELCRDRPELDELLVAAAAALRENKS